LKVNPNELDLSHFSLERVIGKGGFGKVQACVKRSDPDRGKWFAIKTLKKEFILKSSSGIASIYNELYALSELEYIFLCNGHYAFQDENLLYLVLDLALGGDLRYQLRHSKNGHFPEDQTKFYIVQLCLAISYLHSRNMLHRDIKPDNILLCPNGYIKLTDMGISARLENLEDCREFSGTSGYMAPELYSHSHRHGTASDWFSVGVVFHEFLTASRPFSHSHIKAWQNQYDADLQKGEENEKHSHDNLELTVLMQSSSVTQECKSFARSILKMKKSSRLGSSGGLAEILSHSFFKGVDPSKYEKFEVEPPFIPDVSKANVDTGMHDIEEAFGGEDEEKEKVKISPEDQKKFKDYCLNNEIKTDARKSDARINSIVPGTQVVIQTT